MTRWEPEVSAVPVVEPVPPQRVGLVLQDGRHVLLEEDDPAVARFRALAGELLGPPDGRGVTRSG